MKILVIGDFHGKFTSKQFNKLKKEDFDVIFSVGDFCGNEQLSKIGFKYYWGKSREEIAEIPKGILQLEKKLDKKSITDGVSVLNKIKKFGKKFLSVHGNWDPVPWGNDIPRTRDETPKKSDLKRFHEVQTKNFEFIDFKVKNFKDFVLVGGTSSTHPGKIDKKSLAKSFKIIAEVDGVRYARKHINMKVKQSNWRQRKYISAFSKAKRLKKPVIFLTHNAPYNTRLDKVTSKDAPKEARGKHYGSFLERLMINRFKPDLVVCGHMHENFGKQKLGKTLVVNVGSTFHGDYVLIDFNEKTKKFKVVLKKF